VKRTGKWTCRQERIFLIVEGVAVMSGVALVGVVVLAGFEII
jgi:hypothetical protein